MISQPPHFDIAKYLISYSHPDSTLHISATSLSSRQARLCTLEERFMASGYPAGRGLRNGFGWSPIATHEQPIPTDEDRVLGYPNALLTNDRHQTPNPTSSTLGIPVGTPVPAHELFNTSMAVDDRRRRSSSMSPGSIQPSTYRTPYTPFFPSPNYQTLTPPGSYNLTNHTAQAQLVVEPNTQTSNRASLSTVTATTRTSITSANTETPTGTHAHCQRAIFALLSEICNEALRRKWHDETQRQSIRSLASRRSRSSRNRRRSPYAPFSTVPNQHSHTNQGPLRTGAASPSTDQPLRFMELMQRIATAMWENAIQPQNQPQAIQNLTHGVIREPRPTLTSGDSETAAIDSMRTLYSLGNSIMAATSAATSHVEHFNLDEVRDIVGVAAGFCRILGYGEGAERCEEVGRRSLGEEERQARGWEGDVL